MPLPSGRQLPLSLPSDLSGHKSNPVIRLSPGLGRRWRGGTPLSPWSCSPLCGDPRHLLCSLCALPRLSQSGPTPPVQPFLPQWRGHKGPRGSEQGGRGCWTEPPAFQRLPDWEGGLDSASWPGCLNPSDMGMGGVGGGTEGRVLPVSTEASTNWPYMARCGCFNELPSPFGDSQLHFYLPRNPKGTSPLLIYKLKDSQSLLG